MSNFILSPMQKYSEKFFFHKTLIIDIETVPLAEKWDQLPEGLQKHWMHKSQFLRLSDEERDDYAYSFAQRAGIYAEFGKVVCIGLGFIDTSGSAYRLRLKSLKNDNEKTLLEDFYEIVNKQEQQYKGLVFCGHNIKEFDLPYLCRRMLVHGIQLPHCLQLSGRKPWQVEHQDTLELWRFGDYKHYTSLDLLAHCLGVPSPKTEMDGSMVADAYWKEHNLDAVARYCLEDIKTTTEVFLKLKGIHIDLTYEYV